MEHNLTSLKGATEKQFMSSKSKIGIVRTIETNIRTKMAELEEYHDQQRTLDTEIEGQLNIMYKISMQLQTKQQEIEYAFEKYNPQHTRLHRALDALKEK